MTVPGEADGWCATAAIRHGGVVMSGDTDLLLYGHAEMETEGKREWGVIMLRDFSLHQREDGSWQAKALVFRPFEMNRVIFGAGDEAATVIPPQAHSHKTSPMKKSKKRKTATTTPSPTAATRTSITPKPLPTLLNLAYQLRQEPTAGMTRLKQLVRSTQQPQHIGVKEAAWREEYALVPDHFLLTPLDSDGGSGGSWKTKMRLLDPRISELVYQLPCMHAHVHPRVSSPVITRSQTDSLVKKKGSQRSKETATAHIELDAFLPFLYEDPTRSSAWDAGRCVRAMAYSTLQTFQNTEADESIPVRVTVREHVRRGKRIKAVEVGEGGEVSIPCLADGDGMWGLLDAIPHVDGMPGWVGVVVGLVVIDYLSKEKTGPSTRELEATG